MEFLYGEGPRHQKLTLQQHLRTCAECRLRIGSWQSSMAHLDRWDTAPEPAVIPARFLQPALRWAAAAVIVLSLGFGAGRLTAPTVDPDALRAELEQSLRLALQSQAQQLRDEFRNDWQAALTTRPADNNFQRDLRGGMAQWSDEILASANAGSQRLMAGFLESYQAHQRQQQQAVLALFERAEERHATEHADLRRAVETVAVVAADRFDRTETQLGTLASLAQASLILEDPEDGSGSAQP